MDAGRKYSGFLSLTKDRRPVHRKRSPMNITRILPLEVHARLDTHDEWAFLDVREQGAFDEGHPFWASNAPFSHLEKVMPLLVPRKATSLVVMDETDEGLALRAANRLSQWGFAHVSVMRGGLHSWRLAGLPVHRGIYVPSKAFGEHVDHHQKTPSIDVRELLQWMKDRRKMRLIDCRPFDEFNKATLPGSINCPGVDLSTRAFDLAAQPDTALVIHCAGRTRGILGAQTLINAGLPNRVVTVRNGMAGWLLEGHPLVHGCTSVLPPPSLDALLKGQEFARQAANQYAIATLSADQLAQMQRDPNRTVYVFDVRSPQEYLAGHLDGARSAPGGQLVQCLDAYVAVRGARIVLCDDNGIRSRVTASWLKQMGWSDVYVLEQELCHSVQRTNNSESEKSILSSGEIEAHHFLSVLDLAQEMSKGEVALLDLSDSLRYAESHIAEAWFGVRARLSEAISTMPPHRLLVLTCQDGEFATLSHADAAELSPVPVKVLRGGNLAWEAAGLPMAAGRSRMTTRTDDIWYSPLDRPDPLQAIRDYLEWEIGLNDLIRLERGIRFQHQ